MGKAKFLLHFQNNLKKSIEDLISDKWGYNDFLVTSEERDITGKFSGFIDICIQRQGIDSSVVAIEIEHLSSYDQAKRNIEKMKAWAHNSNFRRCGLLHIINEESYIGKDYVSEIVQFAKNFERRGLGFYYDFKFYNVTDSRLKKRTAHELVHSSEFETRLWMLFESVDMV